MPIMHEPARHTSYVQVDYKDKLNSEEKRWLKKFEREYYFNRGMKPEHKPLHKTKTLRCSVFKKNREAAQEMGYKALPHIQDPDSYAKSHWQDAYGSPAAPLDFTSNKYTATTADDMEDILIDYLDSKKPRTK